MLSTELSGRDLLEAIRDGRMPPPPMATLIGARLESVGDGEVRFAWTRDESTYNGDLVGHATTSIAVNGDPR